MNPDHYFTINSAAVANFKDRGSRFLAYAFPINSKEEFKLQMSELKKEHPKAAHHCFGYRIGTEGNEFRVSDDGEPSGSAGRPILGQIDSKQLTNVVVIIVRYFGGTLLGVPGLINAYKTATALALANASIVQRPVLVNCRIEFDYTKMNEVMRVIKQYDCVIEKQESMLFCFLLVGIPKSHFQEVVSRFNDMEAVKFSSGGG